MSERLPAVATFKQMKGKPIALGDLPDAIITNFVWTIVGEHPNPKGNRDVASVIAKFTKRQAQYGGYEVYRFRDGSFGIATESYHDSFVVGPRGEDFLSVGQNDQLKRHGWKSKADLAAEAEEREQAEREAAEEADPTSLAHVRATVENEGFDYAFRSYSDFHEVKDKKFHKLREAYLAAAKALEDYIA